MKHSISFILFAFILSFLFSGKAFCGGAFGIDDPKQDLDISTSDLPQHITKICQNRTKDLAHEIEVFSYNQDKDFIKLGNDNIEVFIEHVSEDDRNNNHMIRKFRESLEGSRKFFTDPEFFLITPARVGLAIDVGIPVNLAVFYVQLASHFSVNYIDLLEARAFLTKSLKQTNPKSKFAQTTLFEAMLKVRNKQISDITDILRAIHPHIRNTTHLFDKVMKLKLQEVETSLQKIGQNERQYLKEGMDLAQKAFSNPEIQAPWKEIHQKQNN